MPYAYPANLERDADGVTLTFDGLPGATWGATDREALGQAEDFLGTALSACIEDGKPVPEPKVASGRPVVTVPALVAAKLALHNAMLAQGITNVDLAHRLGADEKTVRRLRDPLYRSRIDGVESALRLLGRRLEITAVAA